MRKSGSIVVFMLLLMIHSSLSLTMCKKHELEALLQFKQSFVENPKSLLSSWVGDDCCHWLGVTCDNVTANVIKLNLRNQPAYDVYGYLSRYKSESSLLSFGVSSALIKLKFLSHLDLSWNNFTGSRIPEFIGSMTHLTYLNLSSAGFAGLIPPQLGNLTNLIHLDLNAHGDEFYTYVPYIQGHLEWAFGLSKLKSLDMSTVNMSQALDSVQVLITLPSLLELSLSGCELDNTQISNVVITNTSNSSSSTLQSLSLNGNSFNGAVPLWLRNMSRLEFLNLGDNGGFTSMEGGIWGIMGNPCNFKHLDLSENAIAQADVLEPFITSPKCATYDLEYLDLQGNIINGNLPSNLGLLENLKYFDISGNRFQGQVSASLAKLSGLKYLDLSRNRFQGQVSSSLAKLSGLKYLDLSNNMLSGLIPDVLGHLTEIEHLDISSNSMQGTVSGIGNLSKLSFLDMSFNNINLNFNSSVSRGHLFQLRVFRVQSCGINTVFPQWLRNQTQIQRLDLSYTGISGELPEWLQNMTDIQSLQLAGNQLTGSLPRHMACDGCNLQVLDLHSNMLHGTIPNWLSHLENIFELDLSENLLSGVIFEKENASSLLSGKSLTVLDLSDNMLSGEIQMSSLYLYCSMLILSLRGNNFSGVISSQLCQCQYLQILDLAHNRLTGHIPRCLSSMLFMSDVTNVDDVDITSLEIQEIIKGVTERVAGILGPHTTIDLSCNHFVGTIPDRITSMSKLMQLNLSNNHLTGSIPGEIGNLQMLESLDLSNNNLSGTIPQSLSEIPWLSVLNVSYNNLHGPIPMGNQLQTLDDPSIYAGNSGLCGFPLPDKCFNPKQAPSPTDHDEHGAEKDNEVKDKFDKLWLYLAVMSGVATGFWGVIGTLVIKKSWRHAYFRFVEETGDKIYVPVKIRVNKLKNRKRNVIEI